MLRVERETPCHPTRPSAPRSANAKVLPVSSPLFDLRWSRIVVGRMSSSLPQKLVSARRSGSAWYWMAYRIGLLANDRIQRLPSRMTAGSELAIATRLRHRWTPPRCTGRGNRGRSDRPPATRSCGARPHKPVRARGGTWLAWRESRALERPLGHPFPEPDPGIGRSRTQ